MRVVHCRVVMGGLVGLVLLIVGIAYLVLKPLPQLPPPPPPPQVVNPALGTNSTTPLPPTVVSWPQKLVLTGTVTNKDYNAGAVGEYVLTSKVCTGAAVWAKQGAMYNKNSPGYLYRRKVPGSGKLYWAIGRGSDPNVDCEAETLSFDTGDAPDACGSGGPWLPACAKHWRECQGNNYCDVAESSGRMSGGDGGSPSANPSLLVGQPGGLPPPPPSPAGPSRPPLPSAPPTPLLPPAPPYKLCRAGTYAQISWIRRLCIECPAGRFLENPGGTSIDACYSCPPGTHSGVGATVCIVDKAPPPPPKKSQTSMISPNGKEYPGRGMSTRPTSLSRKRTKWLCAVLFVLS